MTNISVNLFKSIQYSNNPAAVFVTVRWQVSNVQYKLDSNNYTNFFQLGSVTDVPNNIFATPDEGIAYWESTAWSTLLGQMNSNTNQGYTGNTFVQGVIVEAAETDQNWINTLKSGANMVAFSGINKKLNAFTAIKSATVASGVAVFHLTVDGLSTGAAIFPNGVDADSINPAINDSSSTYQMSWALSNSNKTVTVTVNKLGILLGLLGNGAAPNGTIVKLPCVIGN